MKVKAIWAALPRGARIYLAAVGAVGVAGLFTVVTVAAAASPSPSPSPSPGPGQAYCNRFIGHVASNLGKSPSQVQKAISDAIGQTLADAVKNGDLTQKQADAIKSRLGSGSVCSAPAPGSKRGPGPGGFPGRIGGFVPGGPIFNGGPGGLRLGAATLNEYAQALGISQSELTTDLRQGQTVKDIAASRGIDENTFRTKLAAVVKADLDKQVASQNLTQKQEDAILQRIQSGTLPLWDQPLPRKPVAPGASPAPAPSPGA
jgi:hypothetical protein